MVTAWCSHCCRYGDHMMTERSTVVRCAYRCMHCEDRTLPCRNECGAMARGHWWYDEEFCLLCDGTLDSWPCVGLQEMLPRGRGHAKLLMQYQHSAMATVASSSRSGFSLSDSMRQIDTAGAVARVLRVLLTQQKELQQRQVMKSLQKSPNPESTIEGISPKSPLACRVKSHVEDATPCHSNSDDSAQDGGDFSLQDTLPQIIQACRSSRLQLIELAPRLLEESAHTSNSEVSACTSACLHVIQELSVLLENANEVVQGNPQDSGVLEEERRWQNLLAQSPSKGEYEFDFML